MDGADTSSASSCGQAHLSYQLFHAGTPVWTPIYSFTVSKDIFCIHSSSSQYCSGHHRENISSPISVAGSSASVVRARDSALYIRMLGPSAAADSLRSTVSPDSRPALQMPLWLFCELLPCSSPPCHPPTFYRARHLGATNLRLEILATSRIFKMRKVRVG